MAEGRLGWQGSPRVAGRGLGLGLLVAAVVAALGMARLHADTLDGFEVDAEHSGAGEALYSQAGNDWAEAGSSGGEGVFLLGTAGDPDFLGCYGSDITVNPLASGTATLMCDGSSDANFDGQGGDAVTEPEKNVVGPGGKQTNDIWPVSEGNVTAKDDFSHAYSLFHLGDSTCDSDPAADDPFFVVSGHRGDNEGDAFWGFELSQTAPTGFSGLADNTGGTFDLDFNRTPGDLLVSITLVGGGTNPLLEVFTWNGSTFVQSVTSCPANPPAAQGDSLLRTNPSNDVQAPPWNVPACDPTATNPSNACRVVNGGGVAPATAGDNLIAPRDFVEAILDLGAFGAGQFCFHSLIFTSRSAHPLESADLKDIGGVNLNTCLPPTSANPPAGGPTPTPGPPTSFPPTGAAPPNDSGPTWALATAGALLLLTCALATAWRGRSPRRERRRDR